MAYIIISNSTFNYKILISNFTNQNLIYFINFFVNKIHLAIFTIYFCEEHIK